MTTPQTPRRTAGVPTGEIDRYIEDLSSRFNLGLEVPQNGDSPRKRQGQGLSGPAEMGRACEFKLRFLYRKDRAALDVALSTFERDFEILKQGWVHKPFADSDLLPVSRDPASHAESSRRRGQALDGLHRVLDGPYQRAKDACRMTRSFAAGEIPSPIPRSESTGSIADTPIPFPLSSGHGKRRQPDRYADLDTSPKKQRGRTEVEQSSQEIIDAVEAIPVKTLELSAGKKLRQTRLQFPMTKTQIGGDPDTRVLRSSEKSQLEPTEEIMESPNTSFSTLPRSSLWPTPDVQMLNEKLQFERLARVMDTSNTSFTSNVASVFSQEQPVDASTPSSTPDDSIHEISPNDIEIEPKLPEGAQVSEVADLEEEIYGSSFGPDDFIDFNLSQPLESFDLGDGAIDSSTQTEKVPGLENYLQNIFPDLPPCLEKAPLCIRYEITRVFLHAEVPLTNLQIPSIHDLSDYDKLWHFLKTHPLLEAQELPEKSSSKAWKASLENFSQQNHNAVVLSASLRFSTPISRSLFSFRLHPLKTDRSHRLSRRFGSDRFLEISVPPFSGFKIPTIMQQAGQEGYTEVIKWLVRNTHNLLGVKWEAFFVKDVARRKRGRELGVTEESDNTVMNRVHFFATDGIDFESRKTIPPKGEDMRRHTRMTRTAMLNWLVPLQKNEGQRSLKLFSRIGLGLSKTCSTVVLKQAEIKYRKKLMSEDGEEDMGDGAGQISRRMAFNVAQLLNLSHIPSAFQARIGGAKGLWAIDVTDNSDKTWITIYPSQVKWEGKSSAVIQYDYDEAHRTFEVLDWSNPLSSASLNLQLLPLLEDRGKSKITMRKAISELLKNGLFHEIAQQRSAMDSPQAFRKWLRDSQPSIKDRLQDGQVAYRAGLPTTLEEQLNMLLDAGFDAKSLEFLKKLAWKAYAEKCKTLRTKLNISVGRSAYAYITVDFNGLLQPDEAHLGFSNNFSDEVSGFSEVLLNEMDVLVARSPAHFVSDIQKVKAVFKPELMALKDVIVFSSKGNYPLAKKLSGGDYDGDMAWICWEPSLVDNFVNADMPVCPDLVDLGYISQDQTTYAEILRKDPADPVSLFLEQGIEFNLRPRLLGICSNLKEAYCYTKNDVRGYKANFLSTLLSALVDSAKQGYSFSDDDWRRVQTEVIKDKPREPYYKHDTLQGKSNHIIDHLKFTVAKETVDRCLTDFWNSLQKADGIDEDVIRLGQTCKSYTASNQEWKCIITNLEHDISAVHSTWSAHFAKRHARAINFSDPTTSTTDESIMSEFLPTLMETHAKWLAIQPSSIPRPQSVTSTSPAPPIRTNNPSALIQSLTLPTNPDTWSLLKASLAYAAFPRGNFIWWMAGKHLAHLKALSFSPPSTSWSSEYPCNNNSSISGIGNSLVPIIPSMYAMLKPDATYVRLLRSEDADPKFWEVRSESEMPDVGEEGEW